mgnify:CR=1 FL=1
MRSTLFSFTSAGTCSVPGEKFSTALMPDADHEIDDALRRRGGHGDDGDADAVAARESS